MPLVKIDVIKGQRTPEELRKLADTVQQVLLDDFDAPPRDRYQVSLDDVLLLVAAGWLILGPRSLPSMNHMKLSARTQISASIERTSWLLSRYSSRVEIQPQNRGHMHH
jgi:phenylpyruvate tautomerase PptA (4-oxalocrotonate tautomerase family)